jgi:hypothetical protein
MDLGVGESGVFSTRTEAQYSLLTLIEEAIAFLKADPSLAEAVSQGIVGGTPPPWEVPDDRPSSPGNFETFA